MASLKFVSSNNLIKVMEGIKKKFTTKEEFMAKNLATDFDNSDRTQIKDLVDFCKNNLE